MRFALGALAVLLFRAAFSPADGAEITRAHRDASGETRSLSLSTEGLVKLTNSTPTANGARTVALRFPRGEAVDAEALLKKFRQWSALAEKNTVSAAEKELGTIGGAALIFRVESDERRTIRTLVVTGEQDALSPEDARQFLALLEQLPVIDAEMAESNSATANLPEDPREVARNESVGRRAEMHARALETVRRRFPVARAQYSTLGAEDDQFTSCRALEAGSWEARGVVQAKFSGQLERRAWTVRLKPGAGDSIDVLTAEQKPLPNAARRAVTQAAPRP